MLGDHVDKSRTPNYQGLDLDQLAILSYSVGFINEHKDAPLRRKIQGYEDGDANAAL